MVREGQMCQVLEVMVEVGPDVVRQSILDVEDVSVCIFVDLPDVISRIRSVKYLHDFRFRLVL